LTEGVGEAVEEGLAVVSVGVGEGTKLVDGDDEEVPTVTEVGVTEGTGSDDVVGPNGDPVVTVGEDEDLVDVGTSAVAVGVFPEVGTEVVVAVDPELHPLNNPV